MSNDRENINDDLGRLRNLLKGSDHAGEFAVPENYFNESANRLFAGIEANDDVDDAFFAEQKQRILSGISVDAIAHDELKVTEDFFRKQKESILDKTSGAKVIPLRWKLVGYAAAAACIFAAVFFFQPDGSMAENSFAELLNQTDLDENDLEYFASEEDVYDLYLHEEEMAIDTVPPDSLYLDELLDPPAEVQDLTQPVQLDPRTGLPIRKNKNGPKNPSEEEIPRWDDITDEDLLEYLLEEGDEDLLNEIN